MPLSLSQLRFLQSADAETQLQKPLPADLLSAQKTLRKHCSADEAVAIVTLRALRQRAQSSGKLPDWLAESLLATDKLLQQASSYSTAAYVGKRLSRFAGAGVCHVLCSGLGIDAIAAARAGAEIVGKDWSPEAVLCAEHNARIAEVGERCRFEQSDVASAELPADAVVHCDPDRRATGRRAIRLEDCSPGPEFLMGLPERTRAGAIKLSPALGRDVLLRQGLAAEYLSERGACRQLLAWWGDGTTGARATVLAGPMEEPESHGIPNDGLGPVNAGPPGEWVHEPDPAVIAAGCVDALARRLGLWRIVPEVAWLSGNGPVKSPFARSFRVLAEASGRVRDVQRPLRDLGAGSVSVKTRGLKLDTDALQQRLSGKGERALVVFWYRTGDRQRAIVAEPAPS